MILGPLRSPKSSDEFHRRATRQNPRSSGMRLVSPTRVGMGASKRARMDAEYARSEGSDDDRGSAEASFARGPGGKMKRNRKVSSCENCISACAPSARAAC